MFYKMLVASGIFAPTSDFISFMLYSFFNQRRLMVQQTPAVDVNAMEFKTPALYDPSLMSKFSFKTPLITPKFNLRYEYMNEYCANDSLSMIFWFLFYLC